MVAGDMAYQVFRNWKNRRAQQATTVIQKHWKAALLDVDGRKIHRSRVVRKGKKRYDARTMVDDLMFWEPNDDDENDDTVYWPRTKTAMTQMNKRRAKKSGTTTINPGSRARGLRDALVRRVLRTHGTSASAFEPYKRAGWFVMHVQKFKFRPGWAQAHRSNPYERNGAPVLFAAKQSWNPFTLRSALEKFFKASHVGMLTVQGPRSNHNITGQNLENNHPHRPHFGTTLKDLGLNKDSTLHVYLGS